MTTLNISVTEPQFRLVNSKVKFPAMIAGYGAGKTEGLVQRGLKLKWLYPRQDIGYYLPTYPLVRDIGWPRFEQRLSEARIPYRLNKSTKTISVEGRGDIVFRSMDNPQSIIGYDHGHALVDEIDTLPLDKAKDVWRRILARNRQLLPPEAIARGAVNTAAIGTTPEGYKFAYERWYKKASKLYELIRASTFSNLHNLPADYVDTLREDYPLRLLQSYLMGYFVNLTSGSVYPDFDRVLNHTNEAISRGNDLREALHIGMDFNVYNCTATIHVVRNDRPLCLEERTKVRDTPIMIELLKKDFPGHHITVYPDASGGSAHSTGASISDISLLRGAGFLIRAPSRNPYVKDRVHSVNRLIRDTNGNRKYSVNTDKCPVTTAALEQQAYDKNGTPDKAKDLDHAPDSLGYFINYRYPIRSRQAVITEL